MTDEQIVEAAKNVGENTGFGKLVHSPISRGVNSAYGIGFLEGAEWAREQMLNDAVDAEYSATPFGTPMLLFNGWRDHKFGDRVKIIIVNEDEGIH